jgi:hypothetical protein
MAGCTLKTKYAFQGSCPCHHEVSVDIIGLSRLHCPVLLDGAVAYGRMEVSRPPVLLNRAGHGLTRLAIVGRFLFGLLASAL